MDWESAVSVESSQGPERLLSVISRFTVRNLTINNANTGMSHGPFLRASANAPSHLAIFSIWNWGETGFAAIAECSHLTFLPVLKDGPFRVSRVRNGTCTSHSATYYPVYSQQLPSWLRPRHRWDLTIIPGSLSSLDLSTWIHMYQH